jgi:hypothetical protein
MIGNDCSNCKTGFWRESLGIGEAQRVIRDRLQTRADKLVFVRADPGITFGEFVEFIDAVRSEAKVLSLVTPKVEQRLSQTWCLSPSEHGLRVLWAPPIQAVK